MERFSEGGDPACWLERVCDECGRFREDLTADRCANCGASFDGVPTPIAGPAVEPERDRDAAGRARSTRPRDGLGRPLPYGMTGVQRQPEGVVRTPIDTLVAAQRLLDEGLPFHAHEVLEDAWKAAPEPDRELWRGLAQLAVGMTHAARGNTAGATALLRRGAGNIEQYRENPPYDIDVTGLIGWATEHAEQPAADIEAPRLRAPA